MGGKRLAFLFHTYGSYVWPVYRASVESAKTKHESQALTERVAEYI